MPIKSRGSWCRRTHTAISYREKLPSACPSVSEHRRVVCCSCNNFLPNQTPSLYVNGLSGTGVHPPAVPPAATAQPLCCRNALGCIPFLRSWQLYNHPVVVRLLAFCLLFPRSTSFVISWPYRCVLIGAILKLLISDAPTQQAISGHGGRPVTAGGPHQRQYGGVVAIYPTCWKVVGKCYSASHFRRRREHHHAAHALCSPTGPVGVIGAVRRPLMKFV